MPQAPGFAVNARKGYGPAIVAAVLQALAFKDRLPPGDILPGVRLPSLVTFRRLHPRCSSSRVRSHSWGTVLEQCPVLENSAFMLLVLSLKRLK